MTDDDVIDLRKYREQQAREDDGGGLSLMGADGERRHFALPLWRMASVARATWSGLIRARPGGEPTPITVVDTVSVDTRPTPPGGLPGDPLLPPPAITEEPDGTLLVAVGVVKGDSWYVALGGRTPAPLEPREREDLLFLAGECAGLVALFDE